MAAVAVEDLAVPVAIRAGVGSGGGGNQNRRQTDLGIAGGLTAGPVEGCRRRSVKPVEAGKEGVIVGVHTPPPGGGSNPRYLNMATTGREMTIVNTMSAGKLHIPVLSNDRDAVGAVTPRAAGATQTTLPNGDTMYIRRSASTITASSMCSMMVAREQLRRRRIISAGW